MLDAGWTEDGDWMDGGMNSNGNNQNFKSITVLAIILIARILD